MVHVKPNWKKYQLITKKILLILKIYTKFIVSFSSDIFKFFANLIF